MMLGLIKADNRDQHEIRAQLDLLLDKKDEDLVLIIMKMLGVGFEEEGVLEVYLEQRPDFGFLFEALAENDKN
jgi:hypothetical protein